MAIEKALKGKRPELLSHLKGLKAVLQTLLADLPVTDSDGMIKIYTKKSFIKFEEAFELFSGYAAEQDYDFQVNSFTMQDKRKHFRELLFHPSFGLCVYIVSHNLRDQYIVLRPDDIDFELFFEEIASLEYESQTNRFEIDKDFVTDLLSSVDTEWDSKVIRVLLGCNRTLKQLQSIGISCDDTKTLEVLEVIKEKKWVDMAAYDMIQLRLKSQDEALKKSIEGKKKTLQSKIERWPKERLDDIRDDIKVLETRREENSDLLLQATKKIKEKFVTDDKKVQNKNWKCGVIW